MVDVPVVVDNGEDAAGSTGLLGSPAAMGRPRRAAVAIEDDGLDEADGLDDVDAGSGTGAAAEVDGIGALSIENAVKISQTADMHQHYTTAHSRLLPASAAFFAFQASSRSRFNRNFSSSAVSDNDTPFGLELLLVDVAVGVVCLRVLVVVVVVVVE